MKLIGISQLHKIPSAAFISITGAFFARDQYGLCIIIPNVRLTFNHFKRVRARRVLRRVYNLKKRDLIWI